MIRPLRILSSTAHILEVQIGRGPPVEHAGPFKLRDAIADGLHSLGVCLGADFCEVGYWVRALQGPLDDSVATATLVTDIIHPDDLLPMFSLERRYRLSRFFDAHPGR